MLLFFIVLHRYWVFGFWLFVFFCFFVFFLQNRKFVTALHRASLLVGFLQYLLVCVSVSHFGSLQNTSNIVILVVVFCAQ